MPTFKVTDPQTGQTVRLTGDSPPTEAELNQIFSQLSGGEQQVTPPTPTPAAQVVPQVQPQVAPQAAQQPIVPTAQVNQGFTQVAQPISPQPEEEPTFIQKALGAGEVGLGLVTGAVAQPISGLAGLSELAIGGDLRSAAETVEATQEALTFQPRTETGQEFQQAVGETLAPIGEVIQETGDVLGEATQEATGSFILAGLAKSIPEAVLELVGVKGSGRLLTPTAFPKTPKAALSQSAPAVRQLRDKATELYTEISDAGAAIAKSDYQNLGISLNNIARKSGFDPKLTPKVAGFLERVQKDFAKPKILATDIDQLRKIAQIPANAIDNATEVAIASKLIDRIDTFLDTQGEIIAKRHGPDIGSKYKEARSLVARVKKSEVIDDAVFKAEDAASGFENGLRNEMRAILRNKKKRRGFSVEEIKAMRQISQGGALENTLKRLGKLGFGVDQQTNVLMGTLGIGAGGAIGGIPGAAAVGFIGNVAAQTAKKLAGKNQALLKDLVRSGKSGTQITEAYLKHVPKKLQKREDLAKLLLDPSVDSSKVKSFAKSVKTNKKLVEEAAFIADKIKKAQLGGAVATGALLQGSDQANTNQR